MGQGHGSRHRIVADTHLVVAFKFGSHTAQHVDGFGFVGLVDLHQLKAACQRRVFLNVFFVLGPGGGTDGAQHAARQGGFEQVGRVARAGLATRADQCVHFVDEQNDGCGAGLHFVQKRTQAVFKLALHAGPGLQQTHVHHAQLYAADGGRHIVGGDAQGQAFDDSGFAHPRFTDQDGVVLAATHQDVDHLAHLFIAARDRVELALAGPLGPIDGVFLQRILAASAGAHGVAGVTRCAFQAGAVRSLQLGLRRVGQQLRERIAERRLGDFFKLFGDAAQLVGQGPRAQHARQPVAAANLRLVEHQGGIHPTAFDGGFNLVGKIADGRGSARQAVQVAHDVGRKLGRIDFEVAKNAQQVGVVFLQQLVQPVHQFDIGVAAQLAEHGGAFQRLEQQRVEFSKQGESADF